MSDKLSDRPDLLSHDSPHFDGEQYVYDAAEIKEAIDWADALEARLSKMERDLAILYIFYGEDIVERLSAKGTLGAANLKALQQERQEALAGERR